MNEILLGKETTYPTHYDPCLLFPIERKGKRDFHGVDVWNAYELSWLNLKGKPEIAMGEFRIPCNSPFLIESKSLKLYLNSLNQCHFSGPEEVMELMIHDLTSAAEASVEVILKQPPFPGEVIAGICLDDLDISIDTYQVDSHLLKCVGKEMMDETVFSRLLKSNCLCTAQPDWGTVIIHYIGSKIEHASLLKYIISFREHQGFHEDCIERMYTEIMHQCQPQKLTVYGKYTRRGGIDINPFRSNFETLTDHYRLPRQ